MDNCMDYFCWDECMASVPNKKFSRSSPFELVYTWSLDSVMSGASS